MRSSTSNRNRCAPLPLEHAFALLQSARRQAATEHFSLQPHVQLTEAERIFRLHKRHDMLGAIAVLRPYAMLAVGDRFGAVSVSAAAYANETLPLLTRLHAGLVALYSLSCSAYTDPAVAEFFHQYCTLVDLAEPSECSLVIAAAVARIKTYVALAQAGIPTSFSGPLESGPPIQTLDHVRATAAHAKEFLVARSRAIGAGVIVHTKVLQTIAFLECIASAHNDVDAVFERMNRRCDPLYSPLTGQLLHAAALRIREQHEPAIERYRAVAEQGKVANAAHFRSAALFEIALAFNALGQREHAWSPLFDYCTSLYGKLALANKREGLSRVLTPPREPASPMRPRSTTDTLQHARSEPPYLKRALRFIDAQMGEALRVDDIVIAAGVSRRSLERAFRVFRNSSPLDHLRSVRLRYAHQLITTTERSIASISREVGYASAAKFSRDYRSHYGVPPIMARKFNAAAGGSAI